MMGQYLLPFVRSKVFVIESSYDIYAIKHIILIECANKLNLIDCSPLERRYIEEYAEGT